MDFDLIIFDCDGVLIDSEPVSNRVLIDYLAKLGLHLTYEESINTFVGKALSSNRDHIENRLGKALPPEFIYDLQASVIDKFKTELVAINGIHEALKSITLPVCVASGSNHEWIQSGLKIVELLPRFENNIFSASQVERGKPAPDVFLFAAEQMGFSPDKCAVVEDSPTGVKAGVDAGMTVFAYAGTFKPEQLEQAGAHFIFENMHDLPQTLGLQTTKCTSSR